MSFTILFSTIHKSHYTIPTNFYFYLPYFQQKVFQFQQNNQIPNRPYVSHFNISPMYQRTMESTKYSEASKKWHVKARNASSGEVEMYCAKLLVVATRETTNPYTLEVEGLNTFPKV